MRKKTFLGPLIVGISIAFSGAAHAEQCSDGSDAKEDKKNETLNEDCVERDIHFMPGGLGVFFAPNASAEPFYGAGVQLAPYQWSHNNDRFGPSQGGVYVQAALLHSQHSSGTMALFEAGATASLERNSSRRYMIPYFGGAIGGISHSELGTSSYAYPMGGLHIYWHRNLMLDAEGGYHIPFQDIDRARGPRAQLTARFSMW